MNDVTPKAKYTFDQVRDAALGRWRELVFPSFGITVPSTARKHGACPICGGKDRFRCDDKQGKGTWICNQCGAGDGFALIEKSRGLNYSDVLKETAAVLGLEAHSTITAADRQKWRERAEQQQRDAEADEHKAQQAAAARAKRIWDKPSEDRDCPYLVRKKVKNHGCKVNGKGNLIVPLYDITGKLWNVQEIHADGFKPYLKGGRVNGCFWVLGRISEPTQIVCIAEGYATAASIFEATGYATVVAFQSGNIDKVGIAIRSKYPHVRLVYCADDDSHSNPPNAGLNAANKAVAATGGIVVLPKFEQVTA